MIRELSIVPARDPSIDRKSTRLNSSHLVISYAVFCLKKKDVGRDAPWVTDTQRSSGGVVVVAEAEAGQVRFATATGFVVVFFFFFFKEARAQRDPFFPPQRLSPV